MNAWGRRIRSTGSLSVRLYRWTTGQARPVQVLQASHLPNPLIPHHSSPIILSTFLTPNSLKHYLGSEITQPASIERLLSRFTMAYKSPPLDSAGSSPSIGAGWRAGADYKAYWQDRLNITDGRFTYERDLVLRRIRQKWQYGDPFPDGQGGRDELKKWLQPILCKFDNISPHFSYLRGSNNEGEALLSLYTDFAFFVHQHYRHTPRRGARARDHHDSGLEKRQRSGGQEDIPLTKRPRLRSSAGTSNDAARRFSEGIDSAIRSAALLRGTPEHSRMNTNPTSANSETKVADSNTPIKTEPQMKDTAPPSLELRRPTKSACNSFAESSRYEPTVLLD